MTLEIGFVLAVLAVGLVLFVLETLPIEVTAFLILGTLLIGGAVTVEQALAGFGNRAVVRMGASPPRPSSCRRSATRPT